MISLDKVKTVELGRVAAGHLVLVKTPSSVLRLALLALDPPRDATAPPVSVLAYLDAGAVPEVNPLQTHRAPCIDLGAATLRVAPTIGSFSLDHRLSVAGNLAIDQVGVTIICRDARTGAEARVHIPTGVIHDPHNPHRPPQDPGAVWYAPVWELGIADADGEFRKWYEPPRPTASQPIRV
jgi:hypothetical protein